MAQQKYFAHWLTRSLPSDSIGKLTASLQDAQVDLTPHQIDAALFAFKSPLSKSAILADEVGLGKTIEAGVILSQFWAEPKNKEIDIDTAIEKIQTLLSENEDLIMHEGLGYLYYKKGMFETALPYLTKAAEGGFDDSQTMLADIYYNGRLGDKDIDKALDWIIKAINLGNNQARALFAQIIMSNDLQDLLPDKVMRSPSYLELANSTS